MLPTGPNAGKIYRYTAHAGQSRAQNDWGAGCAICSTGGYAGPNLQRSDGVWVSAGELVPPSDDRPSALKILAQTSIAPTTMVRDLTDDEVARLRAVVEGEMIVEGDLRRVVRGNIQRLLEINCYRGMRHRRGLPVRGQRTKTNARTRRGTKRTVAGKKKATK